jgi:hypothetical protein
MCLDALVDSLSVVYEGGAHAEASPAVRAEEGLE